MPAGAGRTIDPGMAALIFEDAKLHVINWSDCEFRHDDRDVAGSGHHWIGAVRPALESPSRMGMNVANDGQLAFPADCPQGGKGGRVQNTDASGIGLGIEIIIVDDVGDFSPATTVYTQQKRPRLMPALAANIEFIKNSFPDVSRTTDPVIRRRERPYSRLD